MNEELDKLTNILPDYNEFTDEEGKMKWSNVRNVIITGKEKSCINLQKKRYIFRYSGPQELVYMRLVL